jgi:hypothetical protein
MAHLRFRAYRSSSPEQHRTFRTPNSPTEAQPPGCTVLSLLNDNPIVQPLRFASQSAPPELPPLKQIGFDNSYFLRSPREALRTQKPSLAAQDLFASKIGNIFHGNNSHAQSILLSSRCAHAGDTHPGDLPYPPAGYRGVADVTGTSNRHSNNGVASWLHHHLPLVTSSNSSAFALGVGHDNGFGFDPYQGLTREQQTQEDADAAEQAEGGIIADHESVTDAGYESDAVSAASTSISCSVRVFAFENGRRYHRFREGRYNFPNDDVEQEREDMKHIMLTMLCQQLHFAPIGLNPQEILDIGTGTFSLLVSSDCRGNF